MPLTRRTFLKSAAAAGALALTRPWGALADTLGPAATVLHQPRRPACSPAPALVHADLHNHTLLSDGDGDPERRVRLDARRRPGRRRAHRPLHGPVGQPVDPCAALRRDDARGARRHQRGEVGAAPQSSPTWRTTTGRSSRSAASSGRAPTLGHMSVWFSETWIDPLHTAGATTGEGARRVRARRGRADARRSSSSRYDDAHAALPTHGRLDACRSTTGSRPPADRPVLGGGADGLGEFNHPGPRAGPVRRLRLQEGRRATGSWRWRSSTGATTTCSRAPTTDSTLTAQRVPERRLAGRPLGRDRRARDQLGARDGQGPDRPVGLGASHARRRARGDAGPAVLRHPGSAGCAWTPRPSARRWAASVQHTAGDVQLQAGHRPRPRVVRQAAQRAGPPARPDAPRAIAGAVDRGPDRRRAGRHASPSRSTSPDGNWVVLRVTDPVPAGATTGRRHAVRRDGHGRSPTPAPGS